MAEQSPAAGRGRWAGNGSAGRRGAQPGGQWVEEGHRLAAGGRRVRSGREADSDWIPRFRD